MTEHTTPVNRQASIFLSRKKRVETVREALEIFSAKILEPEVADNIIEMLKSRTRSRLEMTIRIRRDVKTQTEFMVDMDASLKQDLGEPLLFFSLR